MPTMPTTTQLYPTDRGGSATTASLRADFGLALQCAQRGEEARSQALATEEKAQRDLASATEARERADDYLRSAWELEVKTGAALAARIDADNATEAKRRARILPPASARPGRAAK